MADIRIRVPDSIRTGESFEVKTLALAPPLAHPDDGFDSEGLPIPHYVGLRAELDGKAVLNVDLGPGVARDAMFSFYLQIERPTQLTLRWALRDGGNEIRQIALSTR